MNKQNKEVWESDEMVEEFANRIFILKAEQTVLDLIRSKMSNMSMLDIGVGAGRTSQYFAPLARSYIGIDYSPKMIDKCMERFPSIRFMSEDIRKKLFDKDTFDFILFSWNGIDYIDLDDREKAIKNIYETLKPNGLFFFSTHNIEFLQGTEFNHTNMAIVNDGVHGGKLQTYYSRPVVQTGKLLEYGFKNIKIYSHETGEDITGKGVATKGDYCLHYLCQKP